MEHHQFRIGVADSAFCECGAIEDLNHIFFQCPINYYGVCIGVYYHPPWVFLVWWTLTTNMSINRLN